MKLQLDDVALFTRITELGTLSAAARERNVPVSQISRSLSRLESACGARLIHRNTHGLSLTDEGRAMLAQWSDIWRQTRGFVDRFIEGTAV